jgi:hypothetical protein
VVINDVILAAPLNQGEFDILQHVQMVSPHPFQ